MKSKPRLLIIDDDPVVQKSCRRALSGSCTIVIAVNGAEGLSRLETESFDAALVDLKLPDMNGMDILKHGPDRFADVPMVVITGYSTVASAVEAIKLGAFDYIAKPFGPEELEIVIEKALKQRQLLIDYEELQRTLSDRERVLPIIGDSAAMKKVFLLVEQVAKTDSTVLLIGESGTGKELIAHAVHSHSLQKDSRFVAVDCGAIAPNLIASELFGHVRGAFTGATADRTGLMQTADGGTLFLDEIGNLPFDLQASLLRVIETNEMRPVGSSASIKLNVRYISATNQDLGTLISEGKFREDLAYRLNVFPIKIPSLRERREDIPTLGQHFLALFSAKMHKHIEAFTDEAMSALVEYDWPGNVRELSNVVERLAILCGEGMVGLMHVHQALPTADGFETPPTTARELNEARKSARSQASFHVEESFLKEALRRNDFNVTKAAAQTGMQRPNFQALLKKHGLRIADIVEGKHGGEMQS